MRWYKLAKWNAQVNVLLNNCKQNIYVTVNLGWQDSTYDWQIENVTLLASLDCRATCIGYCIATCTTDTFSGRTSDSMTVLM